MFTGIIEQVGRVVRTNLSGSSKVAISAPLLKAVSPGESIAVNGVCLTVAELSGTTAVFDISRETLRRSTLGNLKVDDEVNLERALRLDSRLGGHIVQGHVDATAKYLGHKKSGESYEIAFSLPQSIAQYVCLKGSIAVNGISLTVASLSEDRFSVAVIPYTWHNTTLKTLRTGQMVNLEADILAKYVERLLKFRSSGSQDKTTSILEKLGLSDQQLG
ncbi:MAG: riboflavin synthase [Acidobacteriota bacterium]|nr:riboflavin synthase [Blastocatellia bacterium]MDW8411562.1 riboflavin synthase [Acidobacteriota bacterium]